jgi:hypothetical protein
MSQEFIENRIVSFLNKNGFEVRSGSDFPSTIDIVAAKGDQIVFFELKESGQVDTSDIMRLKSLGEIWSERLGADKSKNLFFVVTKREIPGMVKGLANELRIETYRFDQIGKIFSNPIFERK